MSERIGCVCGLESERLVLLGGMLHARGLRSQLGYWQVYCGERIVPGWRFPSREEARDAVKRLDRWRADIEIEGGRTLDANAKID